eukprot:7024986-Pyramimonas_sp.AAC.1
MENFDRHVSVDARVLNDPTHTRHVGHHPRILHNSVGNENVADFAEYAGGSLAKNASSQYVRIVALCCSCRHRFVAVSFGVKQFLRQCDIRYSYTHLSRNEWPKRTYNGKRDDCCRLSDWAREMATSAAGNMVSLFIASCEEFSAPPPPLLEPSAKRRPRDGAELARREEERSRA